MRDKEEACTPITGGLPFFNVFSCKRREFCYTKFCKSVQWSEGIVLLDIAQVNVNERR